MIADLVGQLDGEIRGQEIRVKHQHVGSFIVWLGDDMVDWRKPIRITANGQETFHGDVKRDLYLCLTEAARTYDLDRLRWAGVRVSQNGSAHILGDEDGLPAVVYEKPK